MVEDLRVSFVRAEVEKGITCDSFSLRFKWDDVVASLPMVCDGWYLFADKFSLCFRKDGKIRQFNPKFKKFQIDYKLVSHA